MYINPSLFVTVWVIDSTSVFFYNYHTIPNIQLINATKLFLKLNSFFLVILGSTKYVSPPLLRSPFPLIFGIFFK